MVRSRSPGLGMAGFSEGLYGQFIGYKNDETRQFSIFFLRPLNEAQMNRNQKEL